MLSISGTLADDDHRILSEAWKRWGSRQQIDMLNEEMAELSVETLHARRRGAVWTPKMASEIADVIICLQQIEMQMRLPEYGYVWDRWVAPIWQEKIDRLAERLQEADQEEERP